MSGNFVTKLYTLKEICRLHQKIEYHPLQYSTSLASKSSVKCIEKLCKRFRNDWSPLPSFIKDLIFIFHNLYDTICLKQEGDY